MGRPVCEPQGRMGWTFVVDGPFQSILRDPFLERLIADYRKHLPTKIEDFPELSLQDVERFESLGKKADRELELENYPAAVTALQLQLKIAVFSPTPYAKLTAVSAAMGDAKSAHLFLRDAVVRGFSDFDRFREAPAFADLRSTKEYKMMARAAPHLRAAEREWNRWSAVGAATAPSAVEAVQDEYAFYQSHLDRIGPVLGSQLTETWKQWIDFAAAALLEQYVEDKPYADDTLDAVVWLFRLYSDSEQFRWATLSSDAAVRLSGIARVVLERYPELNLRADAWVADALATYSRARAGGDRKLSRADLLRIEESLAHVIDEHPGSPRCFDATVGLILAAVASGDIERAQGLYQELASSFGEDERLMARAHEDLGDLRLRLTGLPEFETATLDGTRVDPASLKGKVVLLDFWATWCGPCVSEFDNLRRLQKKHAEDGFQIIGLSMNHEDELTRSGLEQWLAQHEVDWPQVYDGKAWESEIADSLAVQEIPYTILIATDGTVLGTNLHGKELEKEVASAMRAHRRP